MYGSPYRADEGRKLNGVVVEGPAATGDVEAGGWEEEK